MKNHFTMKQQPAIDTFLQSLPYETDCCPDAGME